jgi:hypothetical protein
VLVSKTVGKSIEGVEEGLDVPTAGAKGLIEGGSAAAGVALPIAMKPLVGSRIPGLVQQIGYGIATNVPMGVASRALTHKVLADAGHPEMAEQYKALDEGGLLTDFVLGAAFGTLGHALQAKGGRAPHIEPADVDAALTKGNAYHLEVNTAPGLAKNAETRDAHVDAVLKATEDLMAGRAVDVSVELRAADFQPMPALEAARTELVAQTEALARPIIEAQEETRAITEPVVASRPVGDVEAALRTHFTENPGKPVHVALADSGEVIAWSTSKKRLAEELEQTKAQATRVQRVTAATLDKLLPKPAGALAAGKAEPLGKPIEPERAQAIEQALKTEGVQATSENVATVHLIAQARELDAAAVDKIPEAASDAEYMAKVKEVISANDKTAAAHPDRESAAGEGPGAARGATGQEGAGEGQAARGPEGEARAGGEGAGRVEPLTIEHPEMRAELERMAGEAGWAEIGGRMIRKPEYEGDPNPPVIGRTKWLPKADWWPGRVGKLNEDQTREAVRKALAGEKLKKNEQAAIDYMIDVANERRAERSSIHDEEWAAIAEDLRAEGLEPTHENVVDVGPRGARGRDRRGSS